MSMSSWPGLTYFKHGVFCVDFNDGSKFRDLSKVFYLLRIDCTAANHYTRSSSLRRSAFSPHRPIRKGIHSSDLFASTSYAICISALTCIPKRLSKLHVMHCWNLMTSWRCAPFLLARDNLIISQIGRNINKLMTL